MEWLHGEEGHRSCSLKETTITRLPFLYRNETTALATSFLVLEGFAMLEGGTLNTPTVILYISCLLDDTYSKTSWNTLKYTIP